MSPQKTLISWYKSAAIADRQVTLAEQVEAAAAMLSSDHTQDTLTVQASYQRRGVGARQLVCVSMFMEYAFPPTVNLGLVPLQPVSRYSGGQRSYGFFTLLSQM